MSKVNQDKKATETKAADKTAQSGQTSITDAEQFEKNLDQMEAAEKERQNEALKEAAQRPVKTETVSARVFHEVSELRGNVTILKPSESVEGILTLKEGRKISDYNTPTLEVYNTVTGLHLIPLNVVLESKINALNEKYGEQHHFVRITSLGKREGTKNTYTDYRIELAEATQEELNSLGAFEAAQA